MKTRFVGWKKIVVIFFIVFPIMGICAEPPIQPAAARLLVYLPMLKGKRVAVFANHSSQIGKAHLVDVLLQHHIHIVKIFAPEHGFRTNKDEKIGNSIDTKTGLPIISLYGKKLKPTSDDLKDVDVILFDIQDVGVRFYTYISSLQKLMEAAVINHKPLIILDRPNPNGFYVDGPVLNPKFKSFTGMQPVPIVYGMTIGEYALMLVGQEWLDLTPPSRAKELNLVVIPCLHYTHQRYYIPPVKPSPNLPNIESIYLYPSIGLMEGTVMSVGRGTNRPFQVYGHPLLPTKFTFTPVPKPWSASPPYVHQVCHGWNLTADQMTTLKMIDGKFQIGYLIKAYQLFPHKAHFFYKSFSQSAGNDVLAEQIKAGMSEKEIRASWEPQLSEFKKIRQRYLIYP